MAKKKKPLWLQWFPNRREFLLWLAAVISVGDFLVRLYAALKPAPPVQVIVQVQPPATPVHSHSVVSWEGRSRVLLAGTGVLTITGSDTLSQPS